jgi:hypothetical protein
MAVRRRVRRGHLFHVGVSCLCALAIQTTLTAQVVNPAQAHPTAPEQDETQPRWRSWEIPATVITGEPVSPLREEDRIGSYGQPRWTATRRFPSTRVYVIPEGQFGLEYWSRVQIPRHGATTVETQYEMELGLPHRFQLDLYWVNAKTGDTGDLDITEQKTELRYALADWGVIPANPTLYVEYVSVSGGDDVIESKILLGDEITTGWHWGSNLVWEREIGGELTNTYELTGGISKTLQDERLSLGAEMKIEYEDVHGNRGDFQEGYEIGPSLQWRPFPAAHLDFAPLIGIGDESRAADIYFVLGWEF